jgi:cAMP-binding proteins - catabolite gene activator and regulatory subunit of cAMP-dependent protein kinases
MENKIAIIQRINIAANTLSKMDFQLSRKAVELLAGIMVQKNLSKGEIFCREGQVCEYMSYIEKGLIRQYYYKKHKDVTEHFAADGEMFICTESFIRQTPTHLMVEALEPCELYCIPHDAFEKLAAEYPEIQYFYRYLFGAALILSQAKADTFRYETAHERYERLLRQQPEVVKRAPLQYIASYLLMTPESLSRVRAGLL